ncbi:MAG: DNA mismatch repair endonuclease MutL [Planctomycetales bacterium]|nr:DNA mismatch repair endonuclease MutL [Planctomycetales bacterium]
MPIHRLSQGLVNKIAAGEVVGRPASVVKELMENAVDAGATRIDVSVSQGGLDSIRVVDNGGGIAADELPLAVASHATSKISEADDLFRVDTLGFRGEALASIAAVGRMTLSSRTPEGQSGAEIECVGGELSEIVPCGAPVGTIVEVRDLFYNTPVRRKFLRTSATEFGHVSEAFTRIALPATQVHFSLRHNDKPVLDLPVGGGWLERIALCFGRELAENLIWVESVEDDVSLSGYAAHPSHSRSHNRMQYFFLNGRYIRDRALQHALGEAYRGLLTVGRQPIAFITMRMPPELVDVNVHPTKLEVRFLDSGRLYSQLLAMLRAKFLTTDLHARIQSCGEASSDDAAAAHDAAHTDQLRQQLVDWAKGKVASWDQGPGARDQGSEVGGQRSEDISRGLTAPGEAGAFSPLQLRPLDRVSPADNAAPLSSTAGQAGSATQAGSSARALQVHDRYLVTESEEGVTIIDQHALHERILYEQLKQRVSAGAVETQNLLVPEPVDLSPTEAAAALENRDLLAQLGVRVESFGGDTVLLSGYPAMLANIPPVEVLRAVLERILAEVKQPDRRDLLDDLLHTIACKAAIKAGDRLAPEEIAALLEQRHLVEGSHHCPHGRPTALVFTREELDKRFKRV